MVADGCARYALEHGIQFDKREREVLADMLIDGGLVKDSFLAWAAFKISSDQENAATCRDWLLDSGKVPSVELQLWLEKVQAAAE